MPIIINANYYLDIKLRIVLLIADSSFIIQPFNQL